MGVMVLFVLWVVQDSYHHRMLGFDSSGLINGTFRELGYPILGSF